MEDQQPTITRNPASTEQKLGFIFAFMIIFLESAVLITAPVWEGEAPAWAKEIISQRGHFLATAAAVTMLLALLLAWNPSGLPKYATLSSAMLSLAAALHSIDMNNLITGLAFLSLASPIYIVITPTIRWPESGADWLILFGMSGFISITGISAVLGIPLLTGIFINIVINPLVDLIIMTVLIGPIFCGMIISLRHILSIIVHITSDPWTRFLEFCVMHMGKLTNHLRNRRASRADRRRRERERRRS